MSVLMEAAKRPSEIFEILCTYLVTTVSAQRPKSMIGWQHLYDNTLRRFDTCACERGLDDIESLSAAIVIIGSQYTSLFYVTFNLLQSWKGIHRWFWVLAIELLRHHCLHIIKHESLAGEDLVCKITEIMQNSMSLHQDQTLVTLKDLHSLCRHVSYGDRKVLLEYNRRYSLNSFCGWAIDKLHFVLHFSIPFAKPVQTTLNEAIISSDSSLSSHLIDTSRRPGQLSEITRKVNEKTLRKLEYIESWPPMRPLQGDSGDDFANGAKSDCSVSETKFYDDTVLEDTTLSQSALRANAPNTAAGTFNEISSSSSTSDANEDSSIMSRFSCAMLKAFCAT